MNFENLLMKSQPIIRRVYLETVHLHVRTRPRTHLRTQERTEDRTHECKREVVPANQGRQIDVMSSGRTLRRTTMTPVMTNDERRTTMTPVMKMMTAVARISREIVSSDDDKDYDDDD